MAFKMVSSLLSLLTWLCHVCTVLSAPIADSNVAQPSDLLSYVSPQTSTSGFDACAYTIINNSLVFPNLKLNTNTARSKDCKVNLKLHDLPQGFHFSITNVKSSGYLDLHKGSYLDNISVGISYGSCSNQDTSTVRRAYGFDGTPFTGDFSTSAAVEAGSSKSALGASFCPIDTVSLNMQLNLDVFVALNFEILDIDSTVVPWGALGGDSADQHFAITFTTKWTACSGGISVGSTFSC